MTLWNWLLQLEFQTDTVSICRLSSDVMTSPAPFTNNDDMVDLVRKIETAVYSHFFNSPCHARGMCCVFTHESPVVAAVEISLQWSVIVKIRSGRWCFILDTSNTSKLLYCSNSPLDICSWRIMIMKDQKEYWKVVFGGSWISAVESVTISFEVEKWMLDAQIAYCSPCEFHY